MKTSMKHKKFFTLILQSILFCVLTASTGVFAQETALQTTAPISQNTTTEQPTTPVPAETNVTEAPANPEAQDTQPPQTMAMATPQPAEADDLSHDLSPWGMYQNADIVVKAIMIGLLVASLATWTIFVAKFLELLFAKRRLRKEMAQLKAAKTLNQANEIANKFGESSLGSTLINDAREELELSFGCAFNEGIKERAAFRQDRLVAASGRRMNAGTGILASIGSVSPFVGLFGTVWGIMNSFIGIAKSQTTNLAVVAPGIAEALLATALGLVAAIPAVIIYNLFTRSIAHYRVLVSDISAQTLLLLSRDLDRKKDGTPQTIATPAKTNTPISKIG